jgi:aryl-alcohol dehydrogenase-like predicted oxidoreductase/Ran GTPase-activating protein (RanGAP) involved in mRNA processing and transport
MPLSLGRRPDEAEAVRIIHAAIDAGLGLIDTADAYGRDHREIGHNERLIARALRERPGCGVVVATKGGIERPDGRWKPNGRPEHLRRACEASLKALGVESIALYQWHRPDPEVPFEESVGALAELRRAGKIQAVGLSNVTAAQIRAARTIVPIASVQNRGNVHDRAPWDDGVIAECQRHEITFLAYSPVGGIRRKDQLAADPVLNAIGAKHDATPQQVALAWLVASSPVVIAIPGASRLSSLQGSIRALDLILDADDLAALELEAPSALGSIGRTCRIAGGFTPADPGELKPLLEYLERDEPVPERIDFPVGTLLPDGRLDLCKQGLGPEGTRAVASALQSNTRVAHLLLGANGMGDEGAKAVANLARTSESLRTLYLGCNLIGAEGAESLAEALGANPNLRALWLKRNPIGDAGARALAARLRRPNGLRVLDLVNTHLGRDGLRHVAEALASPEARVERLYLCGNGLSAGDIAPLADLVRSGTVLEALYLSVNRLGDLGAQWLAAALEADRSLRTLSLSSNGIGPEGARALARAIQGHRCLRVLELGYEPSTRVLGERGNQIGDEGAAALAEALPGNRSLEAIDLLRNGISDDGARLLLDALAWNDRLLELALGKGLSSEIRRDLRLLLDRNRAGRTDRAAIDTDPDVAAIRSVYRTGAKA